MSVNCPACGASVASLVFDGSGTASCPNCEGTIRFQAGSQPTVLLPQSGTDSTDPTAVERVRLPLLGRYELLNELGHGGFGTVYRARDTQLDRIVALKIPHSGAFVSADEKARFLREAQTAAGLEHPAIVRVFDAGEINGTPYIASQLVEGKTLANLVSIRTPSSRESAALIARIGDALQHAHDRKLVHRDIKPGNIMVGPDGSPMLMDFGLAKDFLRDTNQTTEGWIKGTPAYMSPEQASGENQRIDHRTDVYSLGIVLYELLTGTRAFRGSPQQILDAIRFDEPRNLRSYSGKVPLDLQTICQKAVEKDPARRYQTAGEFADDLRRWLSNEPIRARRIGVGGRAWRWCRRNRTVAISGASIILILIAATTALSLMYVTERATAQREKQALREANRRLSQLMVVNSKFDTGEDLMAALPWLAEAYRLDQEGEADERRKEISTLRLESAIDAASKLERVWFHDAPITHLAVSRNGERFASASSDGIVRVWDTEQGSLLSELQQGDSAPDALDFLCDSKLLLIKWADEVQVCDSQTGHLQGELTGLNIDELKVNSTSNRVAMIVGKKHIKLWDWSDPSAVGLRELFMGESEDGANLKAPVFNPEGTILAISDSSRQVRLLNAETGQLMEPKLHVSSSVAAICFSRDGELLAVATNDKALQIWKVSVLDQRYPTPVSLPNSVTRLGFSPDGTQLALSGLGAKSPLSVWNVYSKNFEAASWVGEHHVHLTEFSPDRAELLTACDDNRVRIRDTLTGKLTCIPFLHGGMVTAAGFLNGGRIVTGGADRCIRQWKIASDNGVRLRQSKPIDMRFSPDRRTMIVSGKNHSADIYDLSGQPLHPETFTHSGSIGAVDFSSDGRFFATGSADSSARIWNGDTGTPQTDPLLHPESVRKVRFAPDNAHLATACMDQAVRLWDVSTGQCAATWMQPALPIDLAFSARGDWLAVALIDRRISILDPRPPWNVPPERTLSVPADIREITFHPTEPWLLILGYNNVVRIWNTQTGEPVCSFSGHAEQVNTARFSSDGAQVISASDDGTARIWSSLTGREVAPPIRHRRGILDADLSPDARLALTGDSEGMVRVWDTQSGDQVTPSWSLGDAIFRVGFCPQRRIIAVTTSGLWSANHLPQPSARDRNLIAEAELLSGHGLQDGLGIVPIAPEQFRELAEDTSGFPGIEFPQLRDRKSAVAQGP